MPNLQRFIKNKSIAKDCSDSRDSMSLTNKQKLLNVPSCSVQDADWEQNVFFFHCA